MNVIEYEDLKISLEKVTKKIFDIYSSLAELEISGKEESKEYIELRKELKTFIDMERSLNQKMISDLEHSKKYYKAVYDVEEYQIDIENYMISGKSDFLYYNRIPRQFERVVNFKDIRMELLTSYSVQGSKEQKDQFTYTMFSLLTMQDIDIQYERLLAVDRCLREEPLLDKEREAFIRLKYYYIFINSRAESEFLASSFMRNRKFQKNGQYSLDILDGTENQIEYFQNAYKTFYQSSLLRKAKIVIERWCQYPNYRFEHIDLLDLFLTIELQTLLLMMNPDDIDEVRGLAITMNEVMRACDNNLGRRYAATRIFSCINNFENDMKETEESEEVKKAKEKEYKL